MKAPAPEELTELAVLTLINNWCIESLCPEHFEQWEQVLEGLIVSRKKLASWRMSSALAPSKPRDHRAAFRTRFGRLAVY